MPVLIPDEVVLLSSLFLGMYIRLSSYDCKRFHRGYQNEINNRTNLGHSRYTYEVLDWVSKIISPV